MKDWTPYIDTGLINLLLTLKIVIFSIDIMYRQNHTKTGVGVLILCRVDTGIM